MKANIPALLLDTNEFAVRKIRKAKAVSFRRVSALDCFAAHNNAINTAGSAWLCNLNRTV